MHAAGRSAARRPGRSRGCRTDVRDPPARPSRRDTVAARMAPRRAARHPREERDHDRSSQARPRPAFPRRSRGTGAAAAAPPPGREQQHLDPLRYPSKGADRGRRGRPRRAIAPARPWLKRAPGGRPSAPFPGRRARGRITTREKVDRLEEVRLSLSVGPDEDGDPGVELQPYALIAPEVLERELRHPHEALLGEEGLCRHASEEKRRGRSSGVTTSDAWSSAALASRRALPRGFIRSECGAASPRGGSSRRRRP